ncbi:MAG: succinylglutamate desuccinylase/aspartoacylase family protein [Candidatus Heimdallarchaeota archaeon]|nr:succinylglutamate desuccinylase/aspartoacylase family protein [Candidatus Heimdallarchaeota archaeon]MDH5647543.1 succinylglutamate desuccinylase/aspartoacylase family protein [Candidatus Heimdallarchaeota archaeon]
MDVEWTAQKLDVESLPEGKSFGNINLFTNASGKAVGVPIIAIKGQSGPTIGITSALHGNELNGVPVTHMLGSLIDSKTLKGTIIMVPVANLPGFEVSQRKFIDGVDLNRIMPGQSNGTPSDVYAYRLFNRIITQFDCLLDLHTASFGRINSHYIRADITNPHIRKLAELMNAQIIVNSKLPLKSLRNAAMTRGIACITIELGNPSVIQENMVLRGIEGIKNVLSFYEMIPDPIIPPSIPPVICQSSYWLRTSLGGILNVTPKLATSIKKGDNIATLKNLHGKVLKEYKSPEDAIVVGKSINPVVITGGRIIHIGIIGDVEFSDEPQELIVIDHSKHEEEDDYYFDDDDDDSDL